MVRVIPVMRLNRTIQELKYAPGKYKGFLPRCLNRTIQELK